jgi:hypothetical protein
MVIFLPNLWDEKFNYAFNNKIMNFTGPSPARKISTEETNHQEKGKGRAKEEQKNVTKKYGMTKE